MCHLGGDRRWPDLKAMAPIVLLSHDIIVELQTYCTFLHCIFLFFGPELSQDI